MTSSDDEEPDYELLALLKQHLTLKPTPIKVDTRVLRDAEYIVDNAIDVALQREHVVEAADNIWAAMQEKGYSTETWSQHELHPKTKDESTLNFIFTMDLLNFSFWSELSEDERFCVNYRGKRWTGYWSMVALLQRALDEGFAPLVPDVIYFGTYSRGFPGIPITCPYFWVDKQICTDDLLKHVFKSDSKEEIPLLDERIACLREAGELLCEVAYLHFFPPKPGSAEVVRGMTDALCTLSRKQTNLPLPSLFF